MKIELDTKVNPDQTETMTVNIQFNPRNETEEQLVAMMLAQLDFINKYVRMSELTS